LSKTLDTTPASDELHFFATIANTTLQHKRLIEDVDEWGNMIKTWFELSTTRPENRHDRFYRDYERQGEEIREYMNSRGNMHGQSVSFDQQAYSSPTMAAPTGTPVGTPAGSQMNTSGPGGANINQPKFCPNCGNDLSTRQPCEVLPELWAVNSVKHSNGKH